MPPAPAGVDENSSSPSETLSYDGIVVDIDVGVEAEGHRLTFACRMRGCSASHEVGIE